MPGRVLNAPSTDLPRHFMPEGRSGEGGLPSVPQRRHGPNNQRRITMTSTQNRPALNGVDVPMLFATLDTVRAQPAAAQFQFRATNGWLSGTHSRSTIQGSFATPFIYEAEHREVLDGHNTAPTAVECLLHAIAACLTSGIGNIAAARG